MVQQILKSPISKETDSLTRSGTMVRLLIVTEEDKKFVPFQANPGRYGFIYSFASYDNALEEAAGQQPDLIIVEYSFRDEYVAREVIRRIKQQSQRPVIAVVTEDALESLAGRQDIDDFVTLPVTDKELALRINRLVKTTKIAENAELIESKGLVLDPATCEVTVDGNIVELTFKEYELLKLLAGNRGRVFTREALLDNIWGYDYYGGDRTVDVHIRRLRSKIEDANHTYIETVRNIGYKFTKDG
jgi:two-component system alkaline phosphatase synthesis response regulator PhoP